MKRVRVIPVLLLAQNGMVKTQQFSIRPRYLGDPINAVKIFNEKQVDELILLDIEATARVKARVRFDWIEDVVSEAFMPIAYGGGITLAQSLRRAVLPRRGENYPQHFRLRTAATHQRGSRNSSEAKRWWFPSTPDRTGGSRAAPTYAGAAGPQTRHTPVELASSVPKSWGRAKSSSPAVDREGTFGGYDISILRSVSGHER